MKPPFNEVNIGSFMRDVVKSTECYECDHCKREINPGEFLLVHNGTGLDFCSIKCAVDECNKRAWEAKYDL